MPGCVLRASGSSFSPVEFIALFPSANISTRGGTLIAPVSDCDGGNFGGQVRDAIAYLETQRTAVQALLMHPGTRANLDFGVWCKDVFSQSSLFPKELVMLAGALGLGLEVSMYFPPDNSLEANGAAIG
jgi:hypothetical protein